MAEIAVVTGANRGIGFEICAQLKAKGATVVAACRKSSAELDALGVTVVTGVEVTEGPGLSPLVEACKDKKVAVLVNLSLIHI